MTETEDIRDGDAALPAVIEAFVLHWGDLGGQWGVNRSIAQIHAYLYLQEAPVTAETIAGVFGMARSNVSNSLRELVAWNLVRRVPVRGDRRDHFAAETDVHEIAARIAAGRKAREIDPALAALRAADAGAQDDPAVTAVQRARIGAMLRFTEDADRLYGQMLALPRAKREGLMRMGARLASLLPKGRGDGGG